MTDRLDELKRQRALVAGHLAWLDRELAAAGENSLSVEGDRRPERELRDPPAPFPTTPSAQLDPDEIIARFEDKKKSGDPLSRRGCWTVFYSVLLLGVAAVCLLIYLRYY